MIYLPSQRYENYFRALSWSLPDNLLPWLMENRGLGIYLLPKEKARAEAILFGHLKIKERKIAKDGRAVINTAHYRPNERLIILPHSLIKRKEAVSVFLHEVGHAFDFLYESLYGPTLSDYAQVRQWIHPDKPFDHYCKNKYKIHNNCLEQFATGFAAYFAEPEDTSATHCIDKLSTEFISFMNNYVVKPFTPKETGTAHV